LILENDVLGGTDRSYTNGIKIEYVNPSFNLSAFQWMYTPSDITLAENQPDDRPYAGWSGIEYIQKFPRGRYLYAPGIQVGIIGPSSYAEQSQKGAHSIFPAREPMGWDNQIEDKFSLNGLFLQRYILHRDFIQDVIFNQHNSLGTTLTQTGIGLGYRLGYNIPNDYGITQNEPVIQNIDERFIRCYLNTGISMRYVFENHTLTGHPENNTEMENVVYLIYLGPTIEINQWQVTYIHNWRTKEFDKDEKIHSFGTLTFSKRF